MGNLKFILGIDPSPRATGWALLQETQGTRPKLYSSGWVPTAPKLENWHVARQIWAALAQPMTLASIIGIEQPLMMLHGNRFYQQAELIGMITGRMEDHVYKKVLFVSPMTAKATVNAAKIQKGATTKERKEKVIHEVENRFGKLDGSFEQKAAIADSIAIAYAAYVLSPLGDKQSVET